MRTPNYLWTAAVLRHCPDDKLMTRTRLQKTIWLLQATGLPTDYVYLLHFYGPYSEELQSDVSLLGSYGVVEEIEGRRHDNQPYYELRLVKEIALPELDGKVCRSLACLSEQPTVVLELAATLCSFSKLGFDAAESMARLHEKKGSKCSPENLVPMEKLLAQLELKCAQAE